MKNITKIIFFITLTMLSVTSTSYASRKALWIWDTSTLMGVVSSENILMNECINSGITDVYLYCPSGFLSSTTAQNNFQSFISRMTCLNIRVWGMDGWRGYFSDMCGPSSFYEAIQKVIDYNAISEPEERFFGFHSDNEFHANETDCGSVNAFHSGIKDINLSTVVGSGNWKSTQKQDRDSLMADYVKQTMVASKMCHDAGMEYGIAIMSWVTGVTSTHASIGSQTTPLYATYNGVTKPLYQYLMDYVDEYVIMSYHTNVSGKVVPMCTDELTYADGLPLLSRPRIFSGLETFCGVAQYVSYCDTPGENTKGHVNTEMNSHMTLLGTYDSYSGVAIHDWTGWRGLSPTSANTSTPSSLACFVTSNDGSRDGKMKIELYPNPGEDKLFIKIPTDKIELSNVKIYDSKGNIVWHGNTNQSSSVLEVNTESFSSGIYFVDLVEYKTKWIKK